jgi:hypothetical protein
MSYVIIKSDGATLCTIQDGTINTTASSLGLPGRLYPGYGQVFDTNYVYLLENFANNTPPANPLRGQLWYDIGNTVLRICPQDGATSANQWLKIATIDNNGNIAANNAFLSGNIYANNAFLTGNVAANNATANSLFVGNSSGNAFLGFDSFYSGVGEFAGNANNYIEVSLYNSNTGTSASADFSLYDTGGLSSNYYIDIGINGKNFSQPGVWTINGPSDGYLYAGNSNLSIGTPSVGTFINFFTGNSLASNERMRIDTNGNIGIGQSSPVFNLDVTGNIRATGNIIGANVTAIHYGDGGNLSNIAAGNINGTIANAAYATNAGQSATVLVTDDSSSSSTYYPTFVLSDGSSRILGLDTTLSYVASSNTLTVGNLIVSGSITGTATAALTATTAGTVTTAAQPNITSVGTLSNLSVIGNVTAGNVNAILHGNGAGISSIVGANVVGAVSYATIANSVTGANVVGPVSYATAANSVTGANVVGPVSYATSAGTVAGANVVGAVFYAAIANSVTGANVVGPVASANVAVIANSVTGANVSGSVSQANIANVANSVAAANIVGVVAFANVASTANTVAGANVTGTVANATYATSAGTVAGANVTGAVANAIYSVSAGNITYNAQPNITSVGTLTTLAVTGNISGANVTGNLFGNGSGLSSIVGANVTGTVANATYATSAGSASSATTATTATTVSSISSSQVTSALGYTPYNGAANPAGFVPLSNFTEDFNEGGTSGLYYGGTHYGWTQLPNGLIIQWGNNETYHPGEGGVTVTFPVTFPNMVLTVMAVNKGDGYGNTGDDMWVQVPYIYNTGCTVFYQAPSSGNAGYGYRWVAFGY